TRRASTACQWSAQTAALEAWAKANSCKVIGTYTDAGISARKPASKRPELQRLLADVKAGKGDLIVFTKLDRWFRNIAEYYKVQEVLEKYHVDWRTIHEDYDTSTASGRLKINIMLSVAQDEADRTSERIKAVFHTKREKREPLTGNCPTGYRIEGKKLVKDPPTEPAVTAFFQKFLACGSVSVAQREALDHGLRIEYQLASKMLDSPAYYGHYYNTDGMTPPYITKEEFDRIQALRLRTVRKTKQNRTYLFSGIAVCGECGYHLGGRTNVRNKVPLYNCPGHYIKRSGCENKTNISERKIEAYLLDMLEEKVRLYKIEYARMLAEKKDVDYKPEIASIRAKLGKLKELYLNDLISLEEYRTDHAALSARLEELLALDLPKKKPNLERIEQKVCKGWRETYDGLSKADRREFWQALVTEIRIYPDRHIEYDLLD
ncbi:MAG: recombinase family protein, partial [Oscillospiraceae bacterium]|nr:recombinase family protein [Oscillospiraceae bacterium]